MEDIRVSQSRSATPRTSTSQQRGLPVLQRPTCRVVRVVGMDNVDVMSAVKAMIVGKIILMVVW